MVRKNPAKLFWINLFNNFFWLSAVVTFFYLNRGLNYTEILTLGAIMGGAILLFEIPTGIVADKFGRKISLVISSLLLMVSMSFYLFADSFILFAFSFALLGLSITFSSGASEALLFDSLKISGKEKKVKKAFGKYMSAEVLAGFIIPPIASYIAKDLLPAQFTILIYLTLISYFLAFLLILSLKEGKLNGEIPEKNYRLRDVLKNKDLLRWTLNKSFVNVALVSYILLWQPQLQRANIPIVYFGLLLAVGSLIIFFINQNIEKITGKFGDKTSIIFSALFPALGFFLSALFVSPIFSILLYLGIRTTASIREPVIAEKINMEISSKHRAAILSAVSLISALLILALRPLIGYLTDVNFNYGLIFLGLLCGISTFLSLKK